MAEVKIAGQSVQTLPPASADAQARLAEGYGKRPLSFEPNQGQVDARVRFLSRGRGYTLFLTSDEAVLQLNRTGQESRSPPTMPLEHWSSTRP